MNAPIYTCRYCRQPSDASAASCPRCGAPIDLRAVVTRSGWTKQPPIKDMARIQFGASHVQIEGQQVPTADFTLVGDDWIYFSHHTLLWLDPDARVQSMGMAGGWKRVMAGLPIVMVQAAGPADGPRAGGSSGHVGLADNHAGEIVALPMQHGQGIIVREHRFLAATGSIGYDWQQSPIWYVTGSGDDRETHYPLGIYEDRFTSHEAPGLLLLHAPGNVFVRDLAPNETMLMRPGAMLYRDLSVTAHLHIEYPNGSQGGGGGLFGGFSSFSNRNLWLRLIGPGRVAMQSVYEREESSQYIRSSSPATEQHW